MAQAVAYFQNNVSFREGPFVMVDACGWRIEVERKGHYCPVLPQSSIYRFLEKNGIDYSKKKDRPPVEKVVDFLNRAVEEGEIVLVKNSWEWRG